jgi:hypothetical protein
MWKPTAEDQAMFEAMVRGLASQGWRRSRTDEAFASKCVYRGGEERKCAVGWLIPDDKYYPEMENWPLVEVLNLCGITYSDIDWLRIAR